MSSPEEVHKNLDNLKEKCFLLLGTLQEPVLEDPKWNEKFISALVVMDKAMGVFKSKWFFFKTFKLTLGVFAP